MSENVIERLILDMRGYEYLANVPPEDGAAKDYAEEAADEMADWLEAATDPRQFMPALSEWPEEAEWCAIRLGGSASFFGRAPIPKADGNWWPRYFDDYISLCWGVPEIPLGIDWRTLKVSRQQMEEWEESNET